MAGTKHWFRGAIQIKGSVLPAVLPRVMVCAVAAVIVSLCHLRGNQVNYPILSGIVPSVVLGLLLVFRTNTAYERFWEGRKNWGAIVTASRNLSRQIWVTIDDLNSDDPKTKHQEKAQVLRLITAFAIATKQYLRHEPMSDHTLGHLLSPAQLQQLQASHHPPLEIALWIDRFLHRQYQLSPIERTAMVQLLNQLVDSLGACERILRTPMPLAYSIHLKQLLLLYCLILPFTIVGSLGLLTGPIVALVSFTLLGIEAIGLEIENPFGHDPNDLPLNAICANIEATIEALIQTE
jgi:ion channel-forming bestrophin family protein